MKKWKCISKWQTCINLKISVFSQIVYFIKVLVNAWIVSSDQHIKISINFSGKIIFCTDYWWLVSFPLGYINLLFGHVCRVFYFIFLNFIHWIVTGFLRIVLTNLTIIIFVCTCTRTNLMQNFYYCSNCSKKGVQHDRSINITYYAYTTLVLMWMLALKSALENNELLLMIYCISTAF